MPEHKPIKIIPLSEMYAAVWGKQGENNAVMLTYDLSGWMNAWPDGGVAVAFRRADGKEYAHTYAREGNTVFIPIASYDTEISGSCAVVVSWLCDDNEVRSVVIDGRVNPSIVSLGETPTAPEKGLIEQLNDAAAAGDAARVAAVEAQHAAKFAQAEGERAQANAEKAAKDANAEAAAAKTWRDEADARAQDAETAKNEAAASAQEAYKQFVAAESAKVYAQMARDMAETSASNSETQAGNSEMYANIAQEHAEDAAESEKKAKEYAKEAKEAIENATFELFIVNYDGAKIDKTYREIEDAATSGKAPIIVDSHNGAAYYFGTLDASNRRYFDRFAYDQEGKFFNYRLRVSPDSSVSNQSRGVVKTPTENKLTFTGAVTGEYDGSSALTVRIPEGGSGGESNVFVVNITKDEATKKYVADKTLDEIIAAKNRGCAVLAVNNSSLYTTAYISETYAQFERFVRFSGSRSYIQNFIVYNDRVSVNTNDVVVKNPNALTLTGAVEATYDGSSAVNVEIPENTVFAVHTWYDSTDGKWKSDHMLDEINAAVNDGFVPILIQDNKKVYSLKAVSASDVSFTRFEPYSGGVIRESQVRITSSSVVVSSNEVAAPNPNAITFTGAAEATYDGSSAVNVDIPAAVNGKDGEDGFSPTINVSNITGGHRLTITDVNGAKTVDVMNGKDGTGGGGSGATPNWDAKEGEAGYIENRTHWKDVENKAIYSSIQFSPMSDDEPLAPIIDAPEYFPNVGDNAIVAWNNTEYECTFSYVPLEGLDCVACGNLGAVMEGAEITDDPFVLLLIAPEFAEAAGFPAAAFILDGSANVTMSAHVISETFHKLDYRYVSTKYAQPDWGGIDGEVLLPKTVVEINNDGDMPVGVISQKIPVKNGEVCVVTYNGTKYKCTPLNFGDGVFALGNLALLEGTGDTGEPFVMELTTNDNYAAEQGYYAMLLPLDEVLAVTLSIETDGGVHKIPSKFLGDYDQPAWGKEYGGVVWDGSGMMEVEANRQYLLVKPLELEVGKTYKVRFNGADYVVEAFEMPFATTKFVAVGDINLVEGNVTKADPPFLVAGKNELVPELYGMGYGVLNVIEGTPVEEISISDVGDTYHKIPTDFIDTSGLYGVQEKEVVYVEEVQLKQLMSIQFASDVPVNKIPAKGAQCIVSLNGVEYKVTAQEKIRNGVHEIVMGRCASFASDVPLYNDPVPFEIMFYNEPVMYEGFGTLYFSFIWRGDGYIDPPIVSIKAPVGMVNTIEHKYLPPSAGVTVRIVSENYLLRIKDTSGFPEFVENPSYMTNVSTEVINEAIRSGGFAGFALHTIDASTGAVVLFSNMADIDADYDEFGKAKVKEIRIGFEERVMYENEITKANRYHFIRIGSSGTVTRAVVTKL